MSNKLDFPIEKFIYDNDKCLKNDLDILDSNYEKIKDDIIIETKIDDLDILKLTSEKVRDDISNIFWDNKIDGLIKEIKIEDIKKEE